MTAGVVLTGAVVAIIREYKHRNRIAAAALLRLDSKP